jgi:hypothetical protein
MTRKFGLLPRGRRRVHFPSQLIDAVLEFGDLAPGRSVRAGRLHLGHLALDLL